MTYNDKTITYSGDLASYDYDAILRDKQRNINSLYELADYYVDADPIFRGIIKGVYVPFSLSDDYRLVGANEQTKPSSSCDKPFDSRNSRMRAPSAACAVIGIISFSYRIMPQ